MRRGTRRRLRRVWLYLVMIAACVGLAVLIAESDAADTRWYQAAAPAPAGITKVAENSGTPFSSNTTASITNFNTQCSGGENCYLLVTLYTRSSPGSDPACTFGATPINTTEFRDQQNNAAVAIMGEEGLTGTATITCTWLTAREGVLTVRSYSGVNQTTPTNQIDSDKGTPVNSVSVTLLATVANSLVVDQTYFHQVETITSGAGQTDDWVADGPIYTYGASSQPGDGDITMSWSRTLANNACTIAVELNPA